MIKLKMINTNIRYWYLSIFMQMSWEIGFGRLSLTKNNPYYRCAVRQKYIAYTLTIGCVQYRLIEPVRLSLPKPTSSKLLEDTTRNQ